MKSYPQQACQGAFERKLETPLAISVAKKEENHTLTKPTSTG